MVIGEKQNGTVDGFKIWFLIHLVRALSLEEGQSEMAEKGPLPPLVTRLDSTTVPGSSPLGLEQWMKSIQGREVCRGRLG